jgi:hypothetical protein
VQGDGVIALDDGDPGLQDMQEAWESEVSGRELMDAQDALQAMREAAGDCPKCGGFVETNHTEYMGIETFVRYCTECTWEGKPE